MDYNIWKLILKPTSSFLTPIQSDTFFGSMIWALKIINGDEFVEKIIDETKNYNSPFIFSNAIVGDNYPIFGELGESFFDKIDKKLEKSDRKRIEFYKALKKKKYVVKEVFEELLSGKKLEDIYVDVLDGKRNFFDLKETKNINNKETNEEFLSKILNKNNEKKYNKKLEIIDTRIRNQINRIGNSKEGEEETRLFGQDEIKFYDDVEITLFVKIRKDFDMKTFEKGIEYISFNGYGKSASTGKGQFDIIGIEQEKRLEDIKNKNSFVVLSNYIPNEQDNIKPINSNIFTKKPKAYMTENPFKDYFVCYKEGSYFKGNSDTVKGRVLTNIKRDDDKNIQCLIPFVLGVDSE